uniref:Thiamin biosynthesis protein S n=1 Tax=Pleurostichidium falkenbergii TaxID=121064 RepID=A0A4D6UY01_9FLOR|nr:Thiamin biosynthesis protein S [Pleurostichidium falkenbergii]QCH39746.1 Thiamin biosynthesis protein S [Pleurostichidium falkenbergii]
MKIYFTLFINGDAFNCDPSMSLSDIVKYLDIDMNNIIVEYNNQIINRVQFNSIYFKNHDSIEIISIVGGG